MVEAAYRHHGIDARYINCDVAPKALADAVRGAKAMGWLGFNCSIPHKISVIQHLDELAESAAIIGAVNCVVIRDGRLIGENTDGKGFLSSLRTVIEPSGRNVLILGAGGAARAIAAETALAGAETITIVNRDPARGEELAALIAERTPKAAFSPWSSSFAVPNGTQIVVNATSVGLYPDVEAMPEIDLDSLRPGMVVADVIPNPPRTRLIREAETRGTIVLDGLGMLVNQGIAGIRLWTGIEVDAAPMHRTLSEIFGARDPG
jgi:shikimate dehydrogenase